MIDVRRADDGIGMPSTSLVPQRRFAFDEPAEQASGPVTLIARRVRADDAGTLCESVRAHWRWWQRQGLEIGPQASPVRRESCGRHPEGVDRHAPVVDLVLEAAGALQVGRYRAAALIVRTDTVPRHDVVVLPGNAEADLLPVAGSGRCDACGTGEDHSALVVLCEPGTGNVPLQVGLTCLAPVFGARSREAIGCLDTLVQLLGWLTRGAAAREPDESLGADEALALSIAIARRCGGFVSARDAALCRLPTTRERLSRYLADGVVILGGQVATLRPDATDRARAKDVRTWIDTLSMGDPHTYCARLARIAAAGDPVVPEDLAAWISAPTALERLHKHRSMTPPDRGAVGRRGDTITLEVEIRSAQPGFEAVDPILVAAVDGAGRRVAWLARSVTTASPGTRCTVRGIVERHGMLQGRWQTMLRNVDLHEPAARVKLDRIGLPSRGRPERDRSSQGRVRAGD